MAINLSVKELSLDLQSQGYTNTIVLPQGDANSRKLIISLYDGGKKYTIPKSDYITVDLVGSRADGAVVNRHVDDYSDNIITLILRDEELSVKGMAKFKINIVSNEEENHMILSSFPFKIKVAENVYNPNGLAAYPQIDAIEEIIKKASTLTADISVMEAKEQVRQQNENTRIANEQARITAEQNRTSTFTNIQNNVQGIENIDVSANQTDNSFIVSVTDRDGNTVTSENLMGQTGSTPSLSIGTVTTTAPGSNASATITGTDENPVLNLNIPRGANGSLQGMSAVSLPYNGEDDTQTTKDVVDNLTTSVANKIDASNVSTVGKTGQYSDILGVPQIPTKMSDLTNDDGYAQQTVLASTLQAGDTSLTFTSEAITEDSIIDLYAKNNLNVPVKSISYSNQSITVTFDAMENDVPIKVVIH